MDDVESCLVHTVYFYLNVPYCWTLPKFRLALPLSFPDHLSVSVPPAHHHPPGSLSIKVLAKLPIIVVLMYQMYELNIHNMVFEIVPLIMNTMMLQVSPLAR